MQSIAIPTEDGKVCPHLGKAPLFTLVTVSDDGKQFTKEQVAVKETGHIAVVNLLADRGVHTLICGELGLMARSALQMMEIELVPGCAGDVDACVSRYLAGEAQGDPSILEVEITMDENDPMQCMHDCAKCGGCHEIPTEVQKRIPEV